MKIGNILLAIFLWFLIPVSFIFGLIFRSIPLPIGDTSTIDTFCMLGVPIGFFLLGIVVLLLGLKKASVPQQPPVIIQQPLQKEFSRPDRRCPSCGRVIPFDANVCPYCVKKFDELQRDTVQYKCPFCGFEIQSGDVFCENCGKKIKE